MPDLSKYALDQAYNVREMCTDHMNTLVDAAWRAKREADPPRSYLGGSRLGEECLRRLGFEFHQAPQVPELAFSGRLYRVFERGHDAEGRMAKYLRAAGFVLLTEKPDGWQYGFGVLRREDGTPRIAGHIDGIITGWGAPPPAAGFTFSPDAGMWADALPFPMLWEHKGLNNKSWNDTLARGVKLSKPIYYAQMQVYMAYMQVGHAMFTAENQDTCEVFCEIVPFDTKAAQEASDKGVRVVSARDPFELPRVARSETDWRCKRCPYNAACWADNARTGEAPKVAAPAGWGAWSS